VPFVARVCARVREAGKHVPAGQRLSRRLRQGPAPRECEKVFGQAAESQPQQSAPRQPGAVCALVTLLSCMRAFLPCVAMCMVWGVLECGVCLSTAAHDCARALTCVDTQPLAVTHMHCHKQQSHTCTVANSSHTLALSQTTAVTKARKFIEGNSILEELGCGLRGVAWRLPCLHTVVHVTNPRLLLPLDLCR